jgi:hypothetical protein
MTGRLLDAGFIPDALTLLATMVPERRGMEVAVKTLLQHNICIHGEISGILTPLQAAVKKEDVKLVRTILGKGANVNARPGGLKVGRDYRPERTALQIAVESGNLAIVQILIAAGARVDDKPARKFGATALQLAAIQGSLVIAKILLDLGADVNARRCRRFGRTALEGAAEWGRLDMIQLFLSHGVRVEGKGRRQYIRAVKFAGNMGHHVIERLLMNYRQWSEEELRMLDEEDLDDEDLFDPGEWSDNDEMEDSEMGEEPTDEEKTYKQETCEHVKEEWRREEEEADEDGMDIGEHSDDTIQLSSIADIGILTSLNEENWLDQWDDLVDLGGS